MFFLSKQRIQQLLQDYCDKGMVWRRKGKINKPGGIRTLSEFEIFSGKLFDVFTINQD
jgi:hypothetical protein